VREKILAPTGITRMRLGASRDGGQAAGESRYYDARNRQARNVFPGKPQQVPVPYDGFCLEAMDAHGGWIASAVDLARFAAALDDPARAPLLKPETFRLMSAPPPPPAWRKPDGTLDDAFYGCGWMVRPVGKEGKANYWHAGSLPGTASLLVRRHDGLSWAVLFNQRSENKDLPDSAIDPALHRAAQLGASSNQ
jgi:N-acyl-D-amino-acid deacylase